MVNRFLSNLGDTRRKRTVDTGSHQTSGGTNSGHATLPTPALTPRWYSIKKPAPKQPVVKPTTSAYRQQLSLQKNKPTLPFLHTLEDTYTIIQYPKLRMEPHKIIPGLPIPPETMRLVLTDLKRLGVNLDNLDARASVNANPYPTRPNKR